MTVNAGVVVYDQRRRRAYELARDHMSITEQSPHERREIGEYVEQFRSIGFFRVGDAVAALDGVPAQVRVVSFADIRPRSPITLYRVCDPGREHRLSWSPSLRGVLNYAPGGQYGTFHEQPHLFSVAVPGEAILAVMDNEYLIDPRGLEMTDHGSVKAYTSAQYRLGDAVEKWPQMRRMLDVHGPDFPIVMAPTAVYHLVPSDEVGTGPGRAESTRLAEAIIATLNPERRMK